MGPQRPSRTDGVLQPGLCYVISGGRGGKEKGKGEGERRRGKEKGKSKGIVFLGGFDRGMSVEDFVVKT